jgi:hypothetical protein
MNKVSLGGGQGGGGGGSRHKITKIIFRNTEA